MVNQNIGREPEINLHETGPPRHLWIDECRSRWHAHQHRQRPGTPSKCFPDVSLCSLDARSSVALFGRHYWVLPMSSLLLTLSATAKVLRGVMTHVMESLQKFFLDFGRFRVASCFARISFRFPEAAPLPQHLTSVPSHVDASSTKHEGWVLSLAAGHRRRPTALCLRILSTRGPHGGANIGQC